MDGLPSCELCGAPIGSPPLLRWQTSQIRHVTLTVFFLKFFLTLAISGEEWIDETASQL